MQSTAIHARLTSPIALGLPWPLRVARSAGDALQRLAAWRRQRAEQRAAQRQAALHRALVSQLDSATLRDLGLGDWVVARGAGRTPSWIEVDQDPF